MHLRPEYAEPDLAALHAFIRSNPLGVLTTGLPSANHPFLQNTHIPWVLDEPETDPSPNELNNNNNDRKLGVLRGHIARQNPQTKAMIENISSSSSEEEEPVLPSQILLLFTSPVAHYVTPKYYTATKPVAGKVAPTWNYAAVQVYGRARVFYDAADPETDAFLSAQLRDLARFTEEDVMGFTGGEKEEPWTVDEAPERYIALLKKNIVGIRVEIESIEGKFKMSQERPIGDRDGVVAGFQGLGTQVGDEMAELVSERGRLRDQGR
ncbi:Transcriptional regulator [Aspergillus sp. HF37]|nr:Transcriptional regulator [Aspergillus sp. HF37]